MSKTPCSKSPAPQAEALDLVAVRQRLRSSRGPAYWRSLDELADTAQFRDVLEREFPRGASEWDRSVNRRTFVKLMGASIALSGLAACARQPVETIVPYVKPPEEMVPGRAMYFATTVPSEGCGIGVVVESHMGRPTKIEGNPGHPGSLGATSARDQAAILSLYDPDRSVNVTLQGTISTWELCAEAIRQNFEPLRAEQGEGLHILSEAVVSPSLAHQFEQLLGAYPRARWHKYTPGHDDGALEGARLAFGRDVTVRLDLSRAKRALSLDADFLASGPGSVRYAKDFAKGRDADGESPDMNRLYVVEAMPTVTGAMADHRLPMRPGRIERFARTVAAYIRVAGCAEDDALSDQERAFARAVADDLRVHASASLVVAGESQPPVVHAMVHAMNASLGSVGSTVTYSEPVEAHPGNHARSLVDLVQALQAGSVKLLIILGGNPVYNAPADLAMADALERAAMRIQLASHVNETSALCQWHVPEAHALESWGDMRAYDGTVSLVQPLIAPLYGGKTASEVVDVLLGADRTAHAIVQDYWRGKIDAAEFDAFWESALSTGLVPGSALAALGVAMRQDIAFQRDVDDSDGVEIVFRLDPAVGDGSEANNGWLQELPRPLTKVTWDNAVYMSPALAERLGLQREQVVELEVDGRTVAGPVWILPGHADGCVTVHLGYGRTAAGRVGNRVGFNAYAIRNSSAMWAGAEVRVSPTGTRHGLARTEDHHVVTQEGRPLVRLGTLAEFVASPHFAQHMAHESETSLHQRPAYDGHAWGMTIDLNRCNGCNACMVACQAENNIPIVGKEQVIAGREMHWIRVDRYFVGESLDQPQMVHQPVPCMQCEQAPCEVVCPVAATAHSKEGLNDMTYNRCVGTRYCSNNCPYKVRRFNFFNYSKAQYAGENRDSLDAMYNPNVTVRSRGVMEKCTYCVQRISRARIEAKKAGRPVRDGEIVTACQQACPSEAILFGDLSDGGSRLVRAKADPRNYALLGDLNTRPRTTYLAKLRNPNEALEPPGQVGHGGSGDAHGAPAGKGGTDGHGGHA